MEAGLEIFFSISIGRKGTDESVEAKKKIQI